MTIFRRPLFLQLFWVALAIALLWLTLRTASLAQVLAQLRQLEPRQLLLLGIVNVVVLATFSARWWLLLYAQGYAISYPKLVGYRLVTFAVSYFTPGPHFGGEPLQVYLVSTRDKVPVSVSLAAVVMDKLLEMLANFAFLAIGILLVLQQQALPAWFEQQVTLYGFLLLCLPAGLLIALWRGRHPVSGLLNLADRSWQKLRGGSRPPGQTLTQTRVYTTVRESEDQGIYLCRNHPTALVLAVGLSIVSWLAMIGEFWLMTNVLGFELGLGEAMTAMVAARIAILLPLPAGLGALEASQTLAMNALGLQSAAGIAMSILIRGRDVVLGVVGLLFGAVYFWQHNAAKRSLGQPDLVAEVPGTSPLGATQGPTKDSNRIVGD